MNWNCITHLRVRVLKWKCYQPVYLCGYGATTNGLSEAFSKYCAQVDDECQDGAVCVRRESIEEELPAKFSEK